MQHAEELWSKAIENAANFDNIDESNFESSSLSFSGSMINHSDSLTKLIIPKNLHNSLSSVTLTYFDRKAFFLSIGRFAFTVFILTIAILIGGKFTRKQIISPNPDLLDNERIVRFKYFSDSIQKDYYAFIETNLKLHKNYPDILENAASEFNLLDGQLTEIVGQVYRLQREIGNQGINEID